MEVKIKRTEDYIPKWEHNDKSDKPIVFKLKYLTTSESDDCYSITAVQLDIKGKRVGGGKVIVDRKKMFLYGVAEITNLSIVDEADKRVEIKAPEDLLLSPGLDDLYFEVITHIRGMDARIDPKN